MFRHRTDQVLGRYHRRIVRARDGDVDLLGDDAALLVVQRDGEALNPDLIFGQVFHRTVGHRVAPAQRSASASSGRVRSQRRRQTAQVGGHRGASARYQVQIGQVHIGEGDRACVRQVACRCAGLFRHRTDQVLGRYHRRIISPVNQHRQRAAGSAAASVVDGVGKGFRQGGVAKRQRLHDVIGVVHRVGVAAVRADGERTIGAGYAGRATAAG